jgi:hypothetical protein
LYFFLSELLSYLGLLYLFGLWLLAALGRWVGGNIELRKEQKEWQNVNNVGTHDTETGRLASTNQQVRALWHHGDELHELHHGQARFPPNGHRLFRARNLGVHANKVIRVHDGMDETIQGDGQVNVTIIINVRVEPIKEKNGRVMIDMQKGQLTPLFTNHNEKGIPKVPDLGNVKEPQ